MAGPWLHTSQRSVKLAALSKQDRPDRTLDRRLRHQCLPAGELLWTAALDMPRPSLGETDPFDLNHMLLVLKAGPATWAAAHLGPPLAGRAHTLSV